MEPIYVMPLVFDSSPQSTEKVTPPRNFIQNFLGLLQDEKDLSELYSIIGKCNRKSVKPTTEVVMLAIEKEKLAT